MVSLAGKHLLHYFGLALVVCLCFAAALRHDETDQQEIKLHGESFTDWVCVIRYYCQIDPMVDLWKKTHKLDCPDFPIRMYNDTKTCARILPYTAEEDKGGRTSMTREALEQSCQNVLGHWWDLLTGGSNLVSKDDLTMLLERELRHEPLLDWLDLQGEATISKVQIMDYVVPRCVEVGLQAFFGRDITLPHGEGALTHVFGSISYLKNPTENLAFTTYGKRLAKAKTSQQALDEFKTIKVGKLSKAPQEFKEHPRFAYFREQYGVPHDFLSDIAIRWKDLDVGGSGSIFIQHGEYLLKCEVTADWHSPVDWRSFHVRANDYFDYMLTNPDTLLPRFFTAYYDPDLFGKRALGTGENIDAFCFAMQNWIPKAWSKGGDWARYRKGASLEFDFKSSIIYSRKGDTNSRLVRNYDRKKIPGEQGVLKDLNFVDTDTMFLPEDTRKLFSTQLKKDVTFLNSSMIMDYSFFLHFIKVDTKDKLTLDNICPRDKQKPDLNRRAFFQRDQGFVGAVPDWNELLHVYSMGLIDIWQPYSLFKAIGTAYDEVMFPGQVGKFAMNNIPPDNYADRFMQFWRSNVVSKVQLPGKKIPGQVSVSHVRHMDCTRTKDYQNPPRTSSIDTSDKTSDKTSSVDASDKTSHKTFSVNASHKTLSLDASIRLNIK